MFNFFRILLEKLQIRETRLSVSYESLSVFLPMVEHNLPTAKHCGDIERMQVYMFDALGTTFFVISPDRVKIFGYYQLSGNEVLGAYVDPAIRGQNLTVMFFMFLLRNQGMQQIVMGDDHSEKMKELLKKVYRQFRRVYWQRGEEQVEYDPLTVTKFYGTQSTGWKVILESSCSEVEYWQTQSKYFEAFDKKTWYHSDIWYDPTPIVFEGKVMFWSNPF